jgi:hypothetical protein
MFLKAYALDSIEPSLTHILNHILYFTYIHIKYKVRQASFLFSYCTKRTVVKICFQFFYYKRYTFEIAIYIVLKIISGK